MSSAGAAVTVTAEVELRGDRTLVLDVYGDVTVRRRGDWWRHEPEVEDVTVEKATCAGCGQTVELSRDEERACEAALLAAAEKKLRAEHRDAAEEMAQ